MNSNAIIIGSTGLVGSNLTGLLAQDNRFDRVVTLTRRPAKNGSPKVQNTVIDFDCLGDYSELFEGDVLFLCLGTTKRQAGSIAAQRKVDYDYQFHAAKLAAEQGVSQLVLVSSSGANAKSSNPYLRMKGELEDAVLKLGFGSVSIVQPSLLLGDRPEQQDFRPAEEIGAALLPLICRLPWLKRFRPIPAKCVAARMVELAIERREGAQRVRLEDVFPQIGR